MLLPDLVPIVVVGSLLCPWPLFCELLRCYFVSSSLRTFCVSWGSCGVALGCCPSRIRVL